MQMFFSSLSELDQFTHRLQSLPQDNACRNCYKNDQWVSHGYVYKQRSIQQREIVGKRMLCGQRYGKQGCGRTRQLYVDSTVPNRRYRLSVILAFIAQLVRGGSVAHAYHNAVGHSFCEPRQAWRWLTALERQLGRFRLRISRQRAHDTPVTTFRSRRLTILLSTLRHFIRGNDVQSTDQQPFF